MNIRRTKIYIPAPTPVNYLAKYLRWFGVFAICMALYAVLMIAILEFMGGCGETTTTPTELGLPMNACSYLTHQPVVLGRCTRFTSSISVETYRGNQVVLATDTYKQSIMRAVLLVG